MMVGAAKMTRLGLAILVLLAACGRVPPLPSSSAALLSCNLPVYNWGWTTNGKISSIAGQNGFLSPSSGKFTPDPTGVFAWDEATWRYSTGQAPVLHGTAGSTYNRAYRRWLPVPPAQVLADGSIYTYELELRDGSGFDIHVVQVATGADKMIYQMPYDKAYSVLALEPEGVYVVPILHHSGIPGGLWLLSSTAPTLTAVPGAADGTWQVIAGGGAWGGPAGGDRVDRLDLSTGVVTTWFRHAVQVQMGMGTGYSPSVVGFDRSLRPLVEFYPPIDTTASRARTTPTPEVWLVSSPSQATKLTGLPLPDPRLQVGVTDSLGTWLVGADGVYLYTDSGFRRVATSPPPPAPNYTIAGDCA